jgi:hypothetical protein
VKGLLDISRDVGLTNRQRVTAHPKAQRIPKGVMTAHSQGACEIVTSEAKVFLNHELFFTPARRRVNTVRHDPPVRGRNDVGIEVEILCLASSQRHGDLVVNEGGHLTI